MAKSKIASVLAFEKKLVPSDGFMYGTTWENRLDKEKCTPVKIKEKSVRGTISNRLKAGIKNDPLKLNAEVDQPNLQTVDSCALAIDQDTLRLDFTLKILSGIERASACNDERFHNSYSHAVAKYIDNEGFIELAKRYAINIANGRFLWRNRVGAENIEIHIKMLNGTDNLTWKFDATDFNIRDFNINNSEINTLSAKISAVLSGTDDFILFEINAYAKVGKAQDIYPSEELILDKNNSKEKKSKILYHVNDIAAMHSQKIGNALRTVDTWYPDYDTANIGPIALEPYGAVTNLGTAYRTPKAKSDFFTLFDKFSLGEELESREDEHYVMGVLVRGGVFGASSK